MRKGEIVGLQKSDLDFRERTVTVARSYDHDTTKGGHVDVLSMADPLFFILQDAVAWSSSEQVFPNEQGEMRSQRSGTRSCCFECSRAPVSWSTGSTSSAAASGGGDRTPNAAMTIPCGSARSAG